MEYQRKREFLPFAEAIRIERHRMRAALPFQHRVYSYVDRGFYSDQIRRFWHFFPRKQTLFLKNEQLRDNPQKALDRVCLFLSIPLMKNIKPMTVHAYPYKSTMTNSDRLYLKELYEMEIYDLEQMLNWDCSAWLTEN
jgi:hypothetical protein